MMIRRKNKDELNNLNESPIKHVNKNMIIKKNIPIKTDIKKESNISINRIKGKRIFGLSFKKPELTSYRDIINIDNSSFNNSTNKKTLKSYNYKKLLFNSINNKITEEDKKNDFEDNKKNKLKDLLDSPKNKISKTNKFIKNIVSPVPISSFNLEDNEGKKENKENEDKENFQKIETIKNTNFVFNKPKSNNFNRLRINSYKFKHIDSVTNIKPTDIQSIRGLRKSIEINKVINRLDNIDNDNKLLYSERDIKLIPANNKSKKILLNNSLKNIRNENNKIMINSQRSMNSLLNNSNMTNSFHLNKINLEMPQNINQIKFNNANNNNNKIEIKIEDLIMIEERLNDIYIALNRDNKENILNDGSASNECIEFFTFYFKSSIKYSFPLFFNNEKNRLIIKSAINLNLFVVIMIYHLSMNLSLFNQLFSILLKIFKLLKQNLYLIIKQIQTYYGNSNLLNNFYKTFDYIFKKNNILNIDEDEISLKIKNNCIIAVSNISNILNYYKIINNEYYLDFYEIFNRISIINEKDLNNYLYHHLLIQSGKAPPKPNIEYNGKIVNNKLSENIIEKNEINEKMKNIINDYRLKQIKSPFLKEPCNKKYTLVLDLDETLVNVKINEKIKDINDISRYKFNLRPGLFSFLNGVKPYYELISFTNASKEYSDVIINQIEKNRKYFDYNLYREHTVLKGNEFVKDISRIGRDIKKIIIVDNSENNFSLNKENGILIAPFNGDEYINDTKLFYLKNLLLKFNSKDYEDLRIALKEFSFEIINNITLEK